MRKIVDISRTNNEENGFGVFGTPRTYLNVKGAEEVVSLIFN